MPAVERGSPPDSPAQLGSRTAWRRWESGQNTPRPASRKGGGEKRLSRPSWLLRCCRGRRPGISCLSAGRKIVPAETGYWYSGDRPLSRENRLRIAVPAAPAGIRRAEVGPGGQGEGVHAVGERGGARSCRFSSELGDDMSRFPTAVQAASWAGICPGNNESAGKRKSGKSCKGDR
jgi:hypothetical protein